jgi:mRNA interferase MazF
MTVKVHPAPGTIIRVDLSQGFRPPEMGKRRPAVVLSPALAGRSQLCAIVPLSTSAPKIVQPWHYKFQLDPPLPAPYATPVMWAKGDMIQTVAFHRLRLLFDGKDAAGERIYDVRVLEAHHLERIRGCVRAALGL